MKETLMQSQMSVTEYFKRKSRTDPLNLCEMIKNMAIY